MHRRSLRRTWILQILMVVLTIMGVGIDAIPVSLLMTASATESDFTAAKRALSTVRDDDES